VSKYVNLKKQQIPIDQIMHLINIYFKNEHE
jgi:hypothetical protein